MDIQIMNVLKDKEEITIKMLSLLFRIKWPFSVHGLSKELHRSPGALYPRMAKLMECGLVIGRGAGKRKRFKINEDALPIIEETLKFPNNINSKLSELKRKNDWFKDKENYNCYIELKNMESKKISKSNIKKGRRKHKHD